jgi:hypothetical protein
MYLLSRIYGAALSAVQAPVTVLRTSVNCAVIQTRHVFNAARLNAVQRAAVSAACTQELSGLQVRSAVQRAARY